MEGPFGPSSRVTPRDLLGGRHGKFNTGQVARSGPATVVAGPVSVAPRACQEAHISLRCAVYSSLVR